MKLRKITPAAVRLAARCTPVIVAMLLSAGGSRAASPPVADPSEVRNAVATTPVAGTAAGPETWTLCATEGQTCRFTGAHRVRYGTETRNVVVGFAGPVSCRNSVFGDPVPGVAKSCWYSGEPITQPATKWITCADEGQFCAFAGTRAVRYGSFPAFRAGTYTNGVRCANGTFGDPIEGLAKTCSFAAAQIAGDPAPADPAGITGVDAPIILNASGSVHAGDVVSLQGDRFGTSPRVYFEGAPGTPLEIVNRAGTYWLAVQIPADAQGALVLRIANDTGASARVVLNGARPLHLDTLQLVPGGAFRIFGRALLLPGSAPAVTVDGIPASVDLAHSDETMLSVMAPTSLAATAATVISVDNGNGTGPATLDRNIGVVAADAGDPFALGVGWGAAFTAIAGTAIDAATDQRLSQKVLCDGSHDDSAAIRAAVDLAVSVGGGVVRLPAGRCVLTHGFELKSRVVVQGAGKAATEILYASDYPVAGVGLDLAGIGDLTLTNAAGAQEGPLLKDSTRVFLSNVRVRLTTSRQMYLTGNRLFVVIHSDIVQTGSIGQQGPYVFTGSSGLVFEGNTTRWVSGAPAFGRVHDSYIHANHFTRDGGAQYAAGIVHSLAIDFAYRIAVVGNTFDVVDGPIVDVDRNDGETILTEGGGNARTENLGTVATATGDTLSDPANSFEADPFHTGSIPENYGVAIVGGKGAGQTRRLVAVDGSTLTMDRAWDIVPDAGSHYATFVWGLEKSLIKDNVLLQNPRGIWLYQTAIQDVEVVGNTISEGGGIFLRVYQNLPKKSFTPIYNVVIARNRIVNTNGRWMSYINAVFVNTDARAFGIAMLGIDMRSNALTANRPNVSSTLEDYAGTEGFTNLMRVENHSRYESSPVPRLLGTLLTANTCTHCDVAVRIGTGAGGTTILNTGLVHSRALVSDSPTTSSSEISAATVLR